MNAVPRAQGLAAAQPAGTAAPPILDVRDVHKVFGGIRALNGLSIAIADGEIHCVLGPNGAGKSTFFKTLMGTDRPTSGTIHYRGSDITRLPAFRRARLGLSVKFQNIRAFSDLTVYQNLFVPLRRHHGVGEIPGRVAALLARIGLSGTETRLVKELSHGQQQWLAIAMAMASDPTVLLLDEPTAGMSVEETDKSAAIIRDLNAHGVTIVVIEHDMTFIRALAARTSVLHYGKLFAQGSFDEIAADADVRRIYLGSL
ncbi:ABC transporter ATP-binding protein [Chelatococcus reniformis]|uniref:ABC transporter ATP-binding protein n=1 Tax=Chelatococcus reniformis TaxID=1494448 RepID=A0A916U4H9_9HYPH|nr:ABC transporter ATP-binding protein [Chelatococcus reniformis]GGC59054.1 ABC transporter ATP-binding protein [Chelatococcus reniformis]